MTYSSEKLLAFLADKLAFVEISHLPETRGNDYGYSVNLYFPEGEFWESFKTIDILSKLSEQGKQIRKVARKERDETRREVREAILRRAEAERKKKKKSRRKGRGK